MEVWAMGGVVMENAGQLLGQWELDVAGLEERTYRAATPRERERWHARWLLARGWTAEAVGAALDRAPTPSRRG